MTNIVLEDISNMGLAGEGVLNQSPKEHNVGCDREEVLELAENERDLCWDAEVDRVNESCDTEDHFLRVGSDGVSEDAGDCFLLGNLFQSGHIVNLRVSSLLTLVIADNNPSRSKSLLSCFDWMEFRLKEVSWISVG
ncbi:hypothetical protein V6N11_016756 [Hibiscus sabdariffa]|uniref:Uncharacterized protein n=1 Tax=Hibiscus sabdariffa TaxID=183260 RepID=A0ABR2TVX9_9ROSI